MDIIIDGSSVEIEGSPEDVMSVVIAVADELQAQGKAIVDLRVDGQTLPPDELVSQLEGKPIDSVDTIEVGSENIDELVCSELAEIRRVVPDLPEVCHSLAAVFQGNSPQDGYALFNKLAEIWRHVKIIEQQIANSLDLDLDSLSVDNVAVFDLHSDLNEFLREAAQALESGDCVLLGDLLEYELAPRAETESAIIDLLTQKAAEQFGRP